MPGKWYQPTPQLKQQWRVAAKKTTKHNFPNKTSVGYIFCANFHLVYVFFLGGGAMSHDHHQPDLKPRAFDWRQIYPEQLVDPQNAQDLGGFFGR